jgi:murein DD-endopeptidase MepM/ murein hydrolase activator NlpD
MQKVLNGISLPPPGNVTIDLAPGRYGPQTDAVVRTWQASIGDPQDPVGASSVGPLQAAKLFAGTPCHVRAGSPGDAPPPPPPPPPPPAGNITTPVAGSSITTPYGRTGSTWSLGYHTGDDWRAGTGTPVRSTWTGRVVGVFTSGGWGSSYGRHVVVEFTDSAGVRRRYADCHLSRIDVTLGQEVKPGTQIGLAGWSGHVVPASPDGAHLHHEQRKAPYGFNRTDVVKPVY